MTFSTRQYFRSWGLYVRGWTKLGTLAFKPGWSAWGWRPFWLVYGSTYLASVCLGLGVVSLSRWWYDRSLIEKTREWRTVRVENGRLVPNPTQIIKEGPLHPFSRFMTRLLDWAFPGKEHGKHTGPGNLWGSRSAWE